MFRRPHHHDPAPEGPCVHRGISSGHHRFYGTRYTGWMYSTLKRRPRLLLPCLGLTRPSVHGCGYLRLIILEPTEHPSYRGSNATRDDQPVMPFLYSELFLLTTIWTTQHASEHKKKRTVLRFQFYSIGFGRFRVYTSRVFNPINLTPRPVQCNETKQIKCYDEASGRCAWQGPVIRATGER